MRELKQNWKDLFNGFSISLDPRKMFLSFTWLVFTIVGVELFIYAYSRCFFNIQSLPPETGFFGTLVFFFKQLFSVEGGAIHIWQVDELVKFLRDNLWEKGFYKAVISFFLVIYLWGFFVWCRIGGAIYRIAAVEFTTEDRPSLKEALEFSKKRFPNFFWAPMILLLGILLFIFFNFLGGEIAWFIQDKIAVPLGLGAVGPALLSIFFWLALIFGIFIVFLSIGFIFSYDLMCAAVAVDGSDHFDAVSRSLIYLYHRPWEYIFYNLVSIVYGAVVIAFVWAFGLITWKVTLYTVELGSGKEYLSVMTALFYHILNGTHSQASITVASVIFSVFAFIYFGLLSGFAISYYVSAQTCIYCLLRKDVDGTDMNEIYQEDEEEDFVSTLKVKKEEKKEPEHKAEEKKSEEPQKAEEKKEEKKPEEPPKAEEKKEEPK